MAEPESTPVLETPQEVYSSTSPIVYGVSILFILAIIIFIVLSFTQKRTKKGPNCCRGRPGIVFPINLLNPKRRFVYVLACAALSSQWFGLIVRSGGVSSDVNQWVSNLVQIGYVIFFITIIVIITYPIFACVECPIPMIGYILGALYTATYIGFTINLVVHAVQTVDTYNVPTGFKDILYSRLVITYLPQVLCLFGVLIWYVYKIIREIVRLVEARGECSKVFFGQSDSRVNVNYVKRVLTEKNPSFFQKHVYTKVKIPLHILIVFVVASVIVFQLVIYVVFEFPYFFKSFGNEINLLLDQSEDLKSNKYFKVLPRFFDSLTAISVISPIVAAIILLGHFCHFFYTIRAQLKEFRNGRTRRLFPKRLQINYPSLTLASSLRYTGYQVAAIITGWIVYTILIFAVLLLLMLLIFFPSFFGYYFYRVVVLVAWTVFLTVSQMVICKLFFVAKEDSSMKTLVINNRRVFNFFSYAMLLYNIATGLMTAVIRVALSFISMVLLLPRMDKVVFLKGFERLDTGFGMFNSFMAVENLLHNPVVNVFVSCVQSSVKDRQTGHERYEGSLKYFAESTGISSPVRSVKARNRWFVAYTLIKNPNLRKTHTTSAAAYFNNDDDDNLPLALPLTDNNLPHLPLPDDKPEVGFASPYATLTNN